MPPRLERTTGGRPVSANGNGLVPERVTGIQRARMLIAMAEVCAELGAANVTVAHVVARSGVSRRTFYEQFTDREDCFLAALQEALHCAGKYVLPAYDPSERWRERIRHGLIGVLSFLEDEPYLGRLLIVESLSGGERALALRQQTLAKLLAVIDEGRTEARNGPNLPALTAEGAVGGVLSILHARLAGTQPGPLLELTGQLVSILVLPYLGAPTAQRELRRPAPERSQAHKPAPANLLHDLDMRLTYRTIRMLLSVAHHPRGSNRELGQAAEIQDQGQISKLLSRLEKLGLIENQGSGHVRGGPNAWTLTERGTEVQRTIAQQSSSGPWASSESRPSLQRLAPPPGGR